MLPPVRIAALETLLFGESQSARGLIQRLSALETDLYGSEQTGTVMERIQSLEDTLM